MARKRRPSLARTVLLLLIVVALGATLVDRLGLPMDVGSGSAPPPEVPARLEVDTAALERARALNVVDGDTIDVQVHGQEERVRYYGVDTPERGDPCFDEAVDRNRALVGSEVLLEPDARDRDRYGRLLRYIFTPDGESVDAALIAEGLGRAWTEDGAHRDEFMDLEAQARAAERGCLWSD